LGRQQQLIDGIRSRIAIMSIEDIEKAALKLSPKARARLAEKLLESLEDLSQEENDRVWAEEARRRDADWDAQKTSGKPAADALREARTKLK
jgi:putative addiction module component